MTNHLIMNRRSLTYVSAMAMALATMPADAAQGRRDAPQPREFDPDDYPASRLKPRYLDSTGVERMKAAEAKRERKAAAKLARTQRPTP